MATQTEGRRKLIDYMVQSGATVAQAEEIYDLAVHAAGEALERIAAVANTGSSLLIAQSAYTCALRFLEVNINEAMKKPGWPA